MLFSNGHSYTRTTIKAHDTCTQTSLLPNWAPYTEPHVTLNRHLTFGLMLFSFYFIISITEENCMYRTVLWLLWSQTGRSLLLESFDIIKSLFFFCYSLITHSVLVLNFFRIFTTNSNLLINYLSYRVAAWATQKKTIKCMNKLKI